MVLGSKEKISITEEEEEELGRVIDRPNTTKLTFSGRRIHEPHVTDPPPAPPSIDEEKKSLQEKSTTKTKVCFSLAFFCFWVLFPSFSSLSG